MASHETRIPASGHDASVPAPQVDTAAPEARHEPGPDPVCAASDFARQAAGDRRSPAAKRKARNERGLTTLEWLLIVAAVAGIAALAVVLVQNVVSDVSEQVAGSNARFVAAQLAGEQIVVEAKRPKDDQPRSVEDWGDWERHYETKCDRLRITYGDAGVEEEDVANMFKRPTDEKRTDPLDDDDVLSAAISGVPEAGKPQAVCTISE
ncbi:hypothetical protein [Candidatus Poriferisodalis sp.]|uniref:hypothetical protein n=1 Tax=Candidatus Poriferisodalis sp. TaxID=3101277 RepID=UPI003B02868C